MILVLLVVLVLVDQIYQGIRFCTTEWKQEELQQTDGAEANICFRMGK